MGKDTAPQQSYSQEAYNLNNLVIKIKREILNGNITTLTIEEIDEVTIPVLSLLRKLRSTHKIH